MLEVGAKTGVNVLGIGALVNAYLNWVKAILAFKVKKVAFPMVEFLDSDSYRFWFGLILTFLTRLSSISGNDRS